jgi:hypothetical protein
MNPFRKAALAIRQGAPSAAKPCWPRSCFIERSMRSILVFRVAILAASLALGSGCADAAAQGAGGAGGDGPLSSALDFTASEVEVGGEDYLCFTYDASEFAGRALREIAWTPPAGGCVTLHHATLYAVEHPFPDGPFSCLAMPADAVGLHIWAPGDQALTMPDGFGLEVPANATKLVVQAHVLRLSNAAAETAHVELDFEEREPAHLAAWHSTIADVPEIAPHASASASSRCRARADVQTLFAWPHMHRLGASFHGSIERVDGKVTPLVDVANWNVDSERTHEVVVDIHAGDVIETRCSWDNTTSNVVGPGFKTTDEMCTFGVISWPSSAARCEPL